LTLKYANYVQTGSLTKNLGPATPGQDEYYASRR
jgi:hypothetical protein